MVEYGRPFGNKYGKDVIKDDILASNFDTNYGQAAEDLDVHSDDWTLHSGPSLGKKPDGRGGFTETPAAGITVRARRESNETDTRITTTKPNCLQVGDIIQTGKPTTGEVIVQVEGENKFAGHVGRHGENLAVKITRRAEVEESL